MIFSNADINEYDLYGRLQAVLKSPGTLDIISTTGKQNYGKLNWKTHKKNL